MTDPVSRLSDLPVSEPAPERAIRMRQRCRAELTRGGGRAATRPRAPRTPVRSPLWPAAVAILCVTYVAEALALTFALLHRR